MRTLQIARRFVASEWGGAETAILETGKRLQSQGHPLQIICPNALAESDRERMQGIDIRRHPYFYPYLGLSGQAKLQLDRKGGNLFSLSLLRHLQAEPGVDLLHVHTGKRLGGIVRHVAQTAWIAVRRVIAWWLPRHTLLREAKSG